MFTDKVKEAGNEMKETDHFLFENLGKNEVVRDKFGYGKDDMALSDHTMDVLFEWTFSKPRDKSDGTDEYDEDNPNIFHAHRNIYEWNKIIRFDKKNKTYIAETVFEPDADKYKSVPTFHDIMADYKLSRS